MIILLAFIENNGFENKIVKHSMLFRNFLAVSSRVSKRQSPMAEYRDGLCVCVLT